MKRTALITAITLFLALANTYAQELIELKKPGSDIITWKYMFYNGSVTDPQGKEGLDALTADLIIEGGTKQYTKTQIDSILYPMSAVYYASIDKEVTVFTFQVHKDFADRFYQIASGLLFHPAFNPDDFSRVKDNQQVYVDQVIKSSSDEEYSKMALEDFLFKGTAYQHMVTGTSSGVKSIELKDVIDHYGSRYTRDNVLVGITGDYSDAFRDKIMADVKQLPSLTEKMPEIRQAKMPAGINVEIVQKDNTLGSAIYFGFPINITRADDEFAALMVANSWLGEHRKSYSDLYQKIRSDRSMNYGDYSYIEWYEQGGRNMLPPPHVQRHANYFSVWIRPVQTAASLKSQYPELKNITIGHAHFAIRMALHEIDKLIKNGMSQEDFELTRQFLMSYIKLYVQTPERELAYLMDSRFYGRKDYINEMETLLSNVTLDQVNAAIRKYLQIRNMDITIVTDKSEAGPLAESLKSGKPSPMSYSNTVKEGLPKSILDEDKEVEAFPMKVNSVKIIDSADTFK